MKEWQTRGEIIRICLETEEKLLWSGRPAQGVRLRSSDILLIPLGLLWGGFAIFWDVMALGVFFGGAAEVESLPDIAIIFPLFGVPFILMGLFIFGRFLVDARQRARTFYGVTDKRIIIMSGLFSRKVKSLNLRTLTDLSMSEKSDGSGTVTFGPTHPLAAFFGAAAWPGAGFRGSPHFDLVANVAEAYKIIRHAQGEK